MKIVLLQDRLRGGGTERQTVFLAGGFAAAGHAVTVLTFRPGGVLAPGLAAAGVPHRALQPCDLGVDWFAPGLTRVLRQMQPQVVLAMGRMANCRAGRLQRALPGAAVIATLRTGKTLPLAYRRSLRVARHVIANSAYVCNCWIALDERHRCTVIPNALLAPALLALPTGAPPRPARLLCVAQFRPEKNHAQLLEILAALPPGMEWRLDLVGDGPTRAATERLARRLGLADRVEFHGWLADPAPAYARAAVAVLASRRESLPNFLVEAQGAGVPAVAFDVGGVRECVRDGETGAVVPRERPDLFRQAVARLLAEESARAAQAAAARTWARDRFSPERAVAAHLEVFTRLRGTKE